MSDCLGDTVTSLAARLRRRDISVRDVVQATRARIDRFNPDFRAYSHLAPVDDALIDRLDRELQMDRPRSPFHGLTVSVKGNIPVAGLPFTEGSAMFAGRLAETDADVVARIRAGGGIVMGMTTLSELAMYGVTNPFEPMGLNPWDINRTAGGSSTGAGIAACLGMAQINIGTDSGGSLRNPACHSGVVGLMPRIGRIASAGKPNYSPSLSSIGLVGRCVSDVTLVFAALARTPEPHEFPRSAPETPRIIVPRRLIDAMCDGETSALFGAALDRLAEAGFVIIEQDINGWMEAEAGAGVVSLHEGGKALAAMDISRAGEGIRRRLEAAGRLSADQVSKARAAGARFRGALLDTLAREEADAVVTPTWPFAAPPIEAETVMVQGREVQIDPHRNCFVRVGNACDAVGITLPMGIYPSSGVPAGLHLMAASDEARLLQVAERIERILPPMPAPPPLRPGA